MRDFVGDYFSLPPHDVYIQSAERHFGPANSHCSGVMFLQPTDAVLQLLEATVQEFIRCKAATRCTDQEALNAVIQAGQQPIGRLDPSDYPTGAHFFGWEPTYADPLHYDPSMRALCRQPPVLVHNNWLTGRANKLIRWRMHGLWFVDGGGQEWRHQTEAPTALSSDLTAQPRPDGAAPNVELERLAVL